MIKHIQINIKYKKQTQLHYKCVKKLCINESTWKKRNTANFKTYSVPGWGLLNQFSPFHYFLKITYQILHSYAVTTIKYEYDSKDLIHTFV